MTSGNEAVPFASVAIKGWAQGATSDGQGRFFLPGVPAGRQVLMVSAMGFNELEKRFDLLPGQQLDLGRLRLQEASRELDEVVVTGTLKGMRMADSPVPITLLSAKTFERNPTSNILDALYAVNGINPQVNCNACNTADIGINGMPGPYTMILIDGMPIVSALSSVYGLNGIPNGIIDHVEIVKGPASSLYGSEAIGGVINVITKSGTMAPSFFMDMNASTWGEMTGNMGFGQKVGDKVSTLFSLDGYHFDVEHDQDRDGFIDKTLQKRWSVFNKWDIKQRGGRAAGISLRYYHEDRNGGEAGWNAGDRGVVDFVPYDNDHASPGFNADYVLPNGYTIFNQAYATGFRMPRWFASEADRDAWSDAVHHADPGAAIARDMKYRESIFTNRLEAVGQWQLPFMENLTIQASYNRHDQNSAYGTELFMALQQTGFAQVYWNRKVGQHDLLTGATYRLIHFTDNTIASNNGKNPFSTRMPGLFVQDLWTLGAKASLLLGYRVDHDGTRSQSGSHENVVHSPRVALKYAGDPWHTFRASLGTGYRVVNIFSEDHRALSGQYQARFGEDLKPEKSISTTLDYEVKLVTEHMSVNYNISAYYTHFLNKIYPTRNDAERTLTYYNVTGKEHARNMGGALDMAFTFIFPLRINAGISYNQAQLFELPRDPGTGALEGNRIERSDFEYAPRWSGVFALGHDLGKAFTWDVTGDWRGPMRLPVQGEMNVYDLEGNVVGTEDDPRPGYSPWFTKVNAQVTYHAKNGIEVYGGVKNLFNYVPEHLLVNLGDPFNDRSDVLGGLVFDTEYNYTPQQGITGYAGMRFSF
ncbi:MAG: TonB-dependent receptor [Flavobacteriales bacterium]|nr:TonB-dependent receptor [Flavobacteriales bacterium]MEB2340599.1 TonB-dependent receptor [Flavobacteriia bacterium]